MLIFPNAKLNLGLNVVKKRGDGFHDIESVFYPIFWQDALEIIENKDTNPPFAYSQSGLFIDAKPEENLIYKTWQLINQTKKLPNIKVHLHKNIPMGAGLGGGSANVAFFINSVNTLFNLNFTEIEKIEIASKIGSDCAFFIKNKPVFAQGKGNEFSDITINLNKHYILVVFPDIHSNTKEAYSGLTPKLPQQNLKTVIENTPVENWNENVTNDFEQSIFKKYPAIEEVKSTLYKYNALYASMSGSGSAVYGIFKDKPAISFDANFKTFLQEPNRFS